jgi:tryptophan-rich sensory protein
MNETYNWYQQLIKPSWAPLSWLFGPVWSVLYLLIAISFGYVFYLAIKGRISWVIALPFILNLVLNLIFTPIQFGLRNNLLASIDILAVWLTMIWSFVAICPVARWVVMINVPYFIWVSFATVLQFTITYLNK